MGDFIVCGRNSKIQLLGAVLIVVTGFLLEFTMNDWIVVVICIGMVLSAEAMNSAIEELANEVTGERKERIRKVKDMAAGAVLICSLTSIVVAVLVVARKFSM